jgi:aspartate kinase
MSDTATAACNLPILVLKFGGTSVGDTDKIKRVAGIIAGEALKGQRVVVVVSAMGHSTDHLVDLAKAITPNPSGREYDALLGTGEMVTTALMAMTLNTLGHPAIGLTGGQAGIKTEDLHNRARILEIDTHYVLSQLNAGRIVIVTGFQGVNSQGDMTTLGRGGSDTSAVALAGALGAARCDIYTDVRGVYSTDPRVVPTAVKLDCIAYIEMLELARVGAQVLHPRAVETARQAGVVVAVRSTFDLDDPGTLVLGEDTMEFNRAVAGIASDDSQARMALVGVPDKPGVAADVFGSLAEANISVDMIIQSLDNQKGHTNDIAFTVHLDDLHAATQVLEAVKTRIGAQDLHIDQAIAKISIVGVGMIDRPGIASTMFDALAQAGINIKMISTSEIKISCLVDKAMAKQAVRAIHAAFFPENAQDQPVLVSEKLGY